MKKNKGFSLIELIIVIAIMAILAGVLAPMLMRYIAKARRSTDIDTADKLASALVVALTTEGVRDDAVMHPTTPHPVDSMDGDEFKDAVLSIMDVSSIRGKSRKDVDGNAITNPVFYYTLDETKNKVEIYFGGTTDDCMMYPIVGSRYDDEGK